MEQTLDLGNLEISLRKRLGSQYGGRSDFDDGIQEALVRAWTDIENGMTDRAHILNRAKMWFKAKVYGDGEDPQRWTGEEGRSRAGYRRHTAVQEKVELAYNEYYELHREVPSAAEISRATGVHPTTVSYHIRKMHSYSSYLSSPKEYQHLSLNVMLTFSNGDEIGVESCQVVEGFENEVVAGENFSHLMSYLTDQERKVFTLRYVYGMSNTEIGKVLWPEVASLASRERANKAIKRGLKKLKENVG